MVSFSGPCGPDVRPFALVRVRAAALSETPIDEQASEVIGFALIDTGSDQSSITEQTATRLGLVTNLTSRIATPAGEITVPEYLVDWDLMESSTSLPQKLSENVKSFQDKSVWAANITGLPTVGMIGMDVICLCRFIVDGPKNSFEFTV